MNERTDGRTVERGGPKARKHNAIADIVGWPRHKNAEHGTGKVRQYSIHCFDHILTSAVRNCITSNLKYTQKQKHQKSQKHK